MPKNLTRIFKRIVAYSDWNSTRTIQIKDFSTNVLVIFSIWLAIFETLLPLLYNRVSCYQNTEQAQNKNDYKSKVVRLFSHYLRFCSIFFQEVLGIHRATDNNRDKSNSKPKLLGWLLNPDVVRTVNF